MRWKGQLVEVNEQGRLPGVGGAVVRTFDAPDALQTRFHEIRTKSALNRVPGGSRVPFRWTVNPYRGCTHACVYCQSGETAILMGDGSTRPLADIRTGDEIYGTEVDGHCRRFVRTRVLDHWSVVKPAFRVILADGTELISSGDHRYLAEGRGWMQVDRRPAGSPRRPYLTTDDALLGFGRTADGPVEDTDYRRGYVCGMVRGNGDLATPAADRFRLASADVEALDRLELYLADAGVRAGRVGSAVAGPTRREVQGLRSLVQFPLSPADSWCKGFLAGIFDAQGSSSRGILRISNPDPVLLPLVATSLSRFGFDHVTEASAWSVRIRGGLKERLRFLHLTGGAISREQDLHGTSIESGADLRVVTIEPLGRVMRLYDITTATGDFIGNGVVSHNCFARPTHEFLDMDAGRDFEKEIVVKVNVPEVLRAELARPSWRREHVALGTNTDPYQWVEGRYRLMRGVWEAFRDARNPCSILTKSPLLLRDVDLLQEVAEVADVSACLSVPTLDEKAWRATEPGTPHPRKRLEAVAALNAAGIPSGVLIAPLLPGINDAPEQVEEVIELAKEAGAVTIGGQALFLRGAVREIYFAWLRSHRPDLIPLYERLYGRGGNIAPRDRERIEAPVKVGRVRGVPRRFSPGLDDPKHVAQEAVGGARERDVEQQALF